MQYKTLSLIAPLALALALTPVVAKAQPTAHLQDGTEIQVEILQEVSSKKKFGFVQGSPVRGRVWADVVVDGQVVIEKGTPVMMLVSRLKRSKVAGISGKLTIEARSTTAVDGTAVDLLGGYGMKGKGAKGATGAAAAVVAWPLIFIKGKNAKVPAGTVTPSSVARTVPVLLPTPEDAMEG